MILTLKLNYGDEPSESVTLVDERRVPLVGSVFDNRDRIAREFLNLITRAATRQPRLLRRIWGFGRRKA